MVKHLATHLQVVSRAQLLGMGYGRGVVHGWVRRGNLLAVERGVYTLPATHLTYDRRVYARLLRCGSDAVAGPFSSLALAGLEGFAVCSRIDVIIVRDREVTVTDHQHLRLPKEDRSRHHRVIPVLSAARALIEVAPHVAHKRLRVAFDDARRRRLVTVEHMRRRATALPDHPGALTILDLIGTGALQLESEGERNLQPFLAATLPHEHIEWQVTDLVAGRRLDGAVRRLLLGFEYDSREFHVDREPDYLRDLQSGGDGVQVIRISAGMLRHYPEQTRAGIVAVAAQRERLLHGTGGAVPTIGV